MSIARTERKLHHLVLDKMICASDDERQSGQLAQR